MSLYSELQQAKSEEDVKTIYIKYLKLLNEKGEMLPDVGWYQVRKSLEAHEKEIFSGNGKSSKALKTYFTPTYTAFQTAYQNLAEEILPQVYEYEFLKK